MQRKSRGDVIHDGSLGPSPRLLDDVTELIYILGDTVVKRVILPVAVVDVLDDETVVGKRQFLEEFWASPTGNVFSNTQLAQRDGLEVG
jgi:hypothetical protein